MINGRRWISLVMLMAMLATGSAATAAPQAGVMEKKAEAQTATYKNMPLGAPAGVQDVDALPVRQGEKRSSTTTPAVEVLSTTSTSEKATINTGNDAIQATLFALQQIGSSSTMAYVPIGYYPNGQEVTVIAKGNAWCRVITKDSKSGYMLLAELKFAEAASVDGYVATGNDNIKAGLYASQSDASPVSTYANGTKLKVFSQGTNWCQVQTPDGKTGYMHTSDIRIGTAPSADTYAYVVLPSSMTTLALYETESTSSKVLGGYANNAKVKVLSWGNTFTKVETVDGRIGYMLSNYLNATPGGGGGGTVIGTATVSNPPPNTYLILRKEASPSGTVLGSYRNGTVVQVLEKGTTWTKVSVGGIVGYMMTEYLKFDTTPSPTPPPTGGKAVVSNPPPQTRLILRAGPSTSAASLGSFYNGTVVDVLEYGPVWTRVLVNGIDGYMMTKYLTFGSDINPPAPGQVIMVAVVAHPNPSEYLNLRAARSYNAAVLRRFYNGTIVNVYEYASDWCRVEVGGLNGYMATAYLSFSGGTTPTPPIGPVGYAVVKNPKSTQVLNLRAGMGTGTRSLGQYRNGVQVRVLSYGSVWTHVEVGGKVGYMMTKYLSFGSTPVPSTTIGVVKNPVSSQRLNLRAFKSTTSLSLGQYSNGTVVEIIEYDAVWCYVKIGSLKGYMMTKYLQIR